MKKLLFVFVVLSFAVGQNLDTLFYEGWENGGDEGWENGGDEGWEIIAYDINNDPHGVSTLQANSGDKSYGSGTSTCSSGCHSRKVQFFYDIESISDTTIFDFYLYEDTYRGGNMHLWVKNSITNNWVSIGGYSPRGDLDYNQPGWVNYVDSINIPFNKIKIELRDITNNATYNHLYFDDFTIYSTYTSQIQIQVDTLTFEIEEDQIISDTINLPIKNLGDATLLVDVENTLYWLHSDNNISLIAGDSTFISVWTSGINMEDGNYWGNLLINTNDPENAEIEFPVNLIINPGPDPQISISTDSLYFDYINNTGENSQAITITNTGDDTLIFNLNSGERGTALSFDGVDDRVMLNNFGTLGNFTVSAVFNTEIMTNGSLMSYDGSHGNDVLSVSVDENGFARFVIRDGSISSEVFYTEEEVTDGEWHSVSVTRNQNNLDLYFDNELIVSGEYSYFILDPGRPLEFGYNSHDGSFTQNRYFNGILDEVYIFNRALTQEEIQANRYTGLSGNEEGLVSYWNFNEGEGNTLFDQSGNGNDGTINGATWVESPFFNTVEWLSVDDLTYILAPGEEREITVTVNGDGMDWGSYEGYIQLISNDPLNQIVDIPVTMNVLGPEISVDADSINFEIIANEDSLSSQILTIENTGFDTLEVGLSDIEFGDGIALGFNNSNDRVEFGNSLTSLINLGTLELWFQLKDIDHLASPNIFKINSQNGGVVFNLDIRNNDNIFMALWRGPWNSITTSISIEVDIWYHLAVQWSIEELEMSIYLNGILVGVNSIENQSEPIWEDAFMQGGENSIISEGRLSNEILYRNNFIPNREFNLNQNSTALWHFDEGNGNMIYDETENHIDGVFAGSPEWVETNVPVESNWLTLSQTTLSIPPGESANIEITADASGFEFGEYEANITITSNDPEKQVIDIPVTMNVLGPEISVDADSINFEIIANEDSLSSQILTVSNTGYDTLEVSLSAMSNESGIPEVDEGLFTYGGEFGGHHYFVSNSTATWTNARTICEEQGGHLATIENAEENSFVANLNLSKRFIGLTDEQYEGDWSTWITDEPVTYTNWFPGEPNNFGGIQDFGTINHSQSGKWDDVGLSNGNYGYFMEIDIYQQSLDWLTLSQTTLSIPPGESANIEITANASGYDFGDYDGSIQLTTNDPENPSIEIPVSMNIVPAVYGCMNQNACNYNPDANVEDDSCIYSDENYDCDGICFEDTDNDLICNSLDQFPNCYDDGENNPYDCLGVCNGETECDNISLSYGNNLISFSGIPAIDSTALLLETIEELDVEVNFIIGQGQGLFKTEDGWAGNLTTIDEYSGYWLNIEGSIDWTIPLDSSYSNICTNYNLQYGNNLVSYLGNDNANTIISLGGNMLANNYGFIIGQGVGLFNTSGQWSGNLNNLKKGQGYWLNSYSSTPFRWGIGTDCEMPTEPLIKENINPLFIQSTNQAFYLIKEIEIDGKHPEEEDLILAYNNDILVGSAVYNPELTALPVMGRDISEQTEGFLEDGEIPILKLLKNSGESIILNSTLEGFSNLLVSEIVSVTGSTIIIPTEWSIAPAYPNPFNPKTTIKIGVPVTLHAMSLRVFDINGRLIETLIDNKIEPGFHKVDWNANGLPSGIYLLKLKAEGYSDSQKLMLLK